MDLEPLKKFLETIVVKSKKKGESIALEFSFINVNTDTSEISFDEKTVIEFTENSLFIMEYYEEDTNHFLFDVGQIAKVLDNY